MSDGSTKTIPGKGKVFLSKKELSGQISEMIQSGKLINQGGDPVVIPAVPVLTEELPVPEQVIVEVPDTSSELQPVEIKEEEISEKSDEDTNSLLNELDYSYNISKQEEVIASEESVDETKSPSKKKKNK